MLAGLDSDSSVIAIYISYFLSYINDDTFRGNNIIADKHLSIQVINNIELSLEVN